MNLFNNKSHKFWKKNFRSSTTFFDEGQSEENSRERL